MVSILELSDEPKYTIKTVCEQTGIRAVTLRAWERRHEILSPHRSDNRYRLYSDRDVATLRWIKDRVDNGISISNAANELHTMFQNGIWPEALPTAPTTIIDGVTKTPPEKYSNLLYDALIQHNEEKAGDFLRQAHTIFDLKTICMYVISPCLVEIGEAWFYGKIRITTEHFASTFFRGKLLSLLQAYPVRRSAPYILVGCAPTENHEIGSLMMAVLLRSEGYRIEYLGPDVPVNDLIDYASFEKPDMIILSATLQESALNIVEVQKQLNNIKPTPFFGYGGDIYNSDPTFVEKTEGYFLGKDYIEGLDQVNNLLNNK